MGPAESTLIREMEELMEELTEEYKEVFATYNFDFSWDEFARLPWKQIESKINEKKLDL